MIKTVIKRTMGILMAGVIVVGTIGMGIPVYANNYTDSNFSFSMSNSMQYTSARSKTDTSKLYMKCNSVSASNATYTAHAIGTNSTSNTGSDCSRGYTYSFGAGTAYYMTSWVKENGYSFARIGATPNYSYSFSASGVWSPDNYNKY